MSDPNCRLYLICPADLPPDFDKVLDEALSAGDVAALRLDLSGAEDAAWEAAVAALRPVAHAHGVALILGERADLAPRLRCDGAHLAQSEDAAPARKMLGDLQLGVWCAGSRDLAMQAGEAGADYVTFGPFFGVEEPADAALLTWWVELMELPAVAEGGITPENCGDLVRAGADFLAVGDAVWQHGNGPAAAVRAFNEAIRTHAPEL
jgi:thiamine-phosphate pyrophosphorylase